MLMPALDGAKAVNIGLIANPAVISTVVALRDIEYAEDNEYEIFTSE